ncbi:HK97 family phage prohead protease [Staphylococcus equorum]|uniref:HK97 family phage prohead protease n=1 Tax=Staphylococcus equorum TaxID=246432 RepID=UPI002407BD83|nr:HK97 family phage prohead protease [Staphylococcus equorum]MDG0821341.1 HK97 family phage prohead protease [Staphylococcus equorum]
MSEIEFRTAENIVAKDDDNMIIEGYALRFNTESNPLGQKQKFIETVTSNSLENADLSDVRCLIDHNSSYVLGRTTAKTLDLNVDKEGLHFRCQLPNTSYAKDLYENVKLGNVNQCSFGFAVDKDGDTFEKRSDGLFKRTVNKIKAIRDVSVVTYPAYKDTDVAPALRSIESIQVDEENQIEHNKLMQQAKAKIALSKVKK